MDEFDVLSNQTTMYLAEGQRTFLHPNFTGNIQQIRNNSISDLERNLSDSSGTSSRAFFELSLFLQLRLTFQMIIIAVGIPGNILTIIVTRKKKFRAQNLSILFIALSLSDTFWLLFLPLKDIYEILTGTNIQNLTVISCKLVTTIIWIFSMMSNWILVAITLERALCILIPHRYKVLCNRTREKILLLLIIAIVFAYAVHGLVTLGLRKFGPRVVCTGLEEYDWFYINLKDQLQVALMSFVPFTFIFICNLAIIVSVKRADFKRKETLFHKSSNTDTQTNTMVGMLLSITFAFIFLQGPLAGYLISLKSAEEIVKFIQFDTPGTLTTYVMNSLSYSINFYLYIITGTIFRQEVMIIIGCRRIYCKDAVHSMKTSDTRLSNI